MCFFVLIQNNPSNITGDSQRSHVLINFQQALKYRRSQFGNGYWNGVNETNFINHVSIEWMIMKLFLTRFSIKHLVVHLFTHVGPGHHFLPEGIEVPKDFFAQEVS